jgi:hypothetical protein
MPRYEPVPDDAQVTARPVSASPVEVPGGQEITAPPKRHKRVVREQFNTKIRTDLRARLDRFVEDQESTLQDVTEAALAEYMDRRGG